MGWHLLFRHNRMFGCQARFAIIACPGWPIGSVLSTLQLLPWIKERAFIAAGNAAAPTPRSMGLSETVTKAVAHGTRVQGSKQCQQTKSG